MRPSPYQRRSGMRLSWWQLLLMTILIVVSVLTWNQFGAPLLNPTPEPTAYPALAAATLMPGLTPTVPERLTSADVLPTPTIDPDVTPRTITFPGALVTSRIINAARTYTSWETRYLGSSVGHLQGTSWIGEPGGNVVLAGHVTNELGEPGPFAYLFEAQVGDEILLGEGETVFRYRVSSIEQVEPDAVEYVLQDGIPRLTLITCDDWNFSDQAYDSRLIVIAEPLEE